MFQPQFGFNPIERISILRRFVHPPPLFFDRREALDWAQEQVLASEGITVFSEERLAGHPNSGGYDAVTIANRLKSVFDEARILVTVRTQPKIIGSIYCEYVKGGGFLPIERFVDGRLDIRLPLFDHRFFEYHRLIEKYIELFGDTRILVLPLEMLATQKKKYLGLIGNFLNLDLNDNKICGASVNSSNSHTRTELLRLSNRFDGKKRRSTNVGAINVPPLRILLRALAKIGTVQPIEKVLARNFTEFLRQNTQGRYESSNKKLADLVEWDPQEYGYKVRP